MLKINLQSIFYIILLCSTFVWSDTIRGTTILNWPFVNRLANGQYEGFCIDLLNDLAPLMGIAYTLKPVDDGQYGGWISHNGSINGMIGEVMRGDVDFAIGDITVLTTRARFVDFTLPFMEFGLSALVRKEFVSDGRIRSFKDLSEQTELKYGVKKVGANLPLFHNSPVVAKMYSFMDTHPSVFVSGEREGVEKVKREKYAFIAESPFVEYVVQRDCSLAAIDDRRKNFQFEYAIAVPLNSPLKNRFSKAIRQLKRNGRLQELKDKYWKSDKCIALEVDSVLARPPNRRSDDKGTDTEVIFNRNDKLREQHQRNKDRQSENVRFPHDEVDENDIELLKPRPERGNRRRPVNRRDPNYSTSIHSLSNLLMIISILAAIYLF
ncbi:hypothetical protein RDWZM_002109 [Blomia tropicalis]|uniref:Uncharacterized protein n=1 Tax=Blomia tropicalis TaxID=40697 RepID=A0A9Q0MDQ2_BLOTA|nr:hypothetical protein BLOT_002251 [Blomia tropicalis]KAJ6223564.1 hypothetical protein RDWZM_002109 [Blomia tropicalis]